MEGSFVHIVWSTSRMNFNEFLILFHRLWFQSIMRQFNGNRHVRFINTLCILHVRIQQTKKNYRPFKPTSNGNIFDSKYLSISLQVIAHCNGSAKLAETNRWNTWQNQKKRNELTNINNVYFWHGLKDTMWSDRLQRSRSEFSMIVRPTIETCSLLTSTIWASHLECTNYTNSKTQQRVIEHNKRFCQATNRMASEKHAQGYIDRHISVWFVFFCLRHTVDGEHCTHIYELKKSQRKQVLSIEDARHNIRGLRFLAFSLRSSRCDCVQWNMLIWYLLQCKWQKTPMRYHLTNSQTQAEMLRKNCTTIRSNECHWARVRKREPARYRKRRNKKVE